MKRQIVSAFHSQPPSLPAEHELRARFQQCTTASELHALRQSVAAWVTVAGTQGAPFDMLARLAAFRLEVERALGGLLERIVARGGARIRGESHRGLRPGGLPAGISKQQAARFRQVAAVSEQQFRDFLAAAHARGQVPAASALRRLVAPRRRAVATRHCGSGRAELPAQVLAAIERIMVPDVIVGDCPLGARHRVPAGDGLALAKLAGDVLVTQCPDPAQWLPRLRRLRDEAIVHRVIVVLPAEVWSLWFRQLADPLWTCCFLTDIRGPRSTGVLLAHLGARSEAFRAAVGGMGVTI